MPLARARPATTPSSAAASHPSSKYPGLKAAGEDRQAARNVAANRQQRSPGRAALIQNRTARAHHQTPPTQLTAESIWTNALRKRIRAVTVTAPGLTALRAVPVAAMFAELLPQLIMRHLG